MQSVLGKAVHGGEITPGVSIPGKTAGSALRSLPQKRKPPRASRSVRAACRHGRQTGLGIESLRDYFIPVPIEALATQQKRPDPGQPGRERRPDGYRTSTSLSVHREEDRPETSSPTLPSVANSPSLRNSRR